jgi:hypothetical protein
MRGIFWRFKMATISAIKDSFDGVEWQKKAHLLELQGKQEQADLIHNEIPEWEVIERFTDEHFYAYNDEDYDNPILLSESTSVKDKPKQLRLLENALVYDDYGIVKWLGFDLTSDWDNDLKNVKQKYFGIYNLKKPDLVLKLVAKYGIEFRNPFNQTPLIAAAWMGDVEIIKRLCELGADKEAVDSHGLTAFQVALSQAIRDETYARNKLPEIYNRLVPDSIDLRLSLGNDSELLFIRLENHTIEFLLFNLMTAMFYKVKDSDLYPELKDGLQNTPGVYSLIKHGIDIFEQLKGFTAQDMLDAIKYFPISIFPERFRSVDIINGVLSSNEFLSNSENSQGILFYKLNNKMYLFNPLLIVKENEINEDIFRQNISDDTKDKEFDELIKAFCAQLRFSTIYEQLRSQLDIGFTIECNIRKRVALHFS